MAKLTNREIEIITLCSSGMTTREIAAELWISVSTVKTHRAKIFKKLNVKKITNAIPKAKELGILKG